MSFSLNELWYDIKLSKMQSPFLNSWKRERRGKIPLLSYSSKRGKREVLMSFFICYALEMVMESSIILNFSLIRENMSLKLWGYTLFMWFPKGEKPMCRKRGKIVVVLEKVIHSLNSCFKSFSRFFIVHARF